MGVRFLESVSSLSLITVLAREGARLVRTDVTSYGRYVSFSVRLLRKFFRNTKGRRKMKDRKATTIVLMTLLTLTIVLSALPILAVPPAPLLLDPKTIPKYVNQLTAPPPVYTPEYTTVTAEYYTVDVTEFDQQILPLPFPKTKVWGYGGNTVGGYVGNAPGPTFEATRGTEIYVRYQNKLTDLSHLFAVDPTLHWANPNDFHPAPPFVTPYPPGYPEAQSPVPIIPHLHGGEVQSTSDGHPEAWFTPGGGTFPHGAAYNTELTEWYDGTDIQPYEAVFRYPNEQPPTTLWYHDHALGITRINVMSGLAGFYLLRDPDADTIAPLLPSGECEMPLVIQDRTFDINGQFFFPAVGLNPEHPYWLPEFFGDTIMVNGLVWPNMDVKQGAYRFRLLDGSNARFYTISFWIPNANLLGIPNKLPFTVIGSDGGYLPAPVTVKELTIAPGERWDILVDFSTVPYVAGTSNIILRNTARAPYKGGGGGTPADPQTVGQIMQFTLLDPAVFPGLPAQQLPAVLNPDIPTLPTPAPTDIRQFTLMEIMGPGGPLEVLLDGKKWGAPISELPTLGTTEDWVIVNPTADTHPIHLHLVQFQLVSRQSFQVSKYVTDWWNLNPTAPIGMGDTTPIASPPYQNYLQGKPVLPTAYEQGWKDTIQANPGEVTIIRVRFSPIDGTVYDPTTLYPFDATAGPGYVWHCHILDHEDNEMMRPYVVLPAP